MTERYEAIVIGGGIAGTAVAYHLVDDGTETLLIDRGDEGRATDAGAGIVSAATSSRTDDDAWFAFATDATTYYPELAAELDAAGTEPTSYERLGGVAVAIDDDERESHRAALERVDRREDTADVREIDPENAIEQFPPLAEPQAAIYYPGAARVDGRAFTDAMGSVARANGLEKRDGDVTDLRVEDGAVRGVTTADGRRIDAEHVVVAGGAWSSAFGDRLGVELPVEPKRGQLVHLELPGTDTEGWPVVKGYRHHYVVPWPDGRIVVGATREAGSGYAPRPTAGGIREVLAEALRVAPGLADATLAEIRVGLRPVTPDGRPVLGPVPGVEGAYLATGHGPTGLMLGPYSGKVVADSIGGRTDRIPEPFRPGRFD